MERPFFLFAYRVRQLRDGCYAVTAGDRLDLERGLLNHAPYMNSTRPDRISESWEATGDNRIGDLWLGEDDRHYFCITSDTTAKILPFKRREKNDRVYI